MSGDVGTLDELGCTLCARKMCSGVLANLSTDRKLTALAAPVWNGNGMISFQPGVKAKAEKV